MTYFRDPDLNVDRKSDDTPVTAADRDAETLLRKRIARRFPEDAIVGEEFPEQTGSSGFRWILDPIDGTKSFIHGVPLYSTLIGLEKDARPFAGVIALPALKEMVWAERGQGAWWEAPGFDTPKTLRVSRTETIEESLFLTSEVASFDTFARRGAYTELEKRARLTRTWGDAYGYYLVATGRADFMIDPVLSLWDVGPLPVILEEAGGKLTDWQGNAATFNGETVASNGLVHEQVIACTARFPKRPPELTS